MDPKIISTSKLFGTKWLSLFSRIAHIKGQAVEWTFASRRQDPQPGLQESPAAVQIVPTLITPEGRFVVLTSEFRVPIGSREISFPAGLVEKGELAITAAKRELKEEVGLEIIKVTCVSPINLCSSAGFCDETTQIVFCEAEGIPTNINAEGSEDIQILLVKESEIEFLLHRDDVAFSVKAWCILWGMVYGGLRR